MKLKKISALALSSAMILSMTACSGSSSSETTAADKAATTTASETTTIAETTTAEVTTAESTTAETEKETEKTEETEEDTEESTEENPSGIIPELDPSVASMLMAVDSSTGQLSIQRISHENNLEAEAGTWTVFVYLCGSDLESGGGAASADLGEMLSASSSSNVRFVVLTGGANEWSFEGAEIDASKLQTWLIQDGEITQVNERETANMGDPAILNEFLEFGIENFPAEKLGLIFWNHGSGSINGVCFDELNDSDSLSLQEIDAALLATRNSTGAGFEFIGFDACLMGTVETANVVANYANYMFGSEELEPGCGWNYSALCDYLEETEDADGEGLGKVVADGFYDQCVEIGDFEGTTLTVFNLSKLDDFLVAYNQYYYEIYNIIAQNPLVISTFARSSASVDSFGGNNASEGYTNMIDLGSTIDAFIGTINGAEEAKAALGEVVAYFKSGDRHKNASGVSTYYPLSIQGSVELKAMGEVSVSPYYLAIIDMLQQAAINGLSFDAYDISPIFANSGNWYRLSQYDIDKENGAFTPVCEDGECNSDEYFAYVTETDGTGSRFITFEEEPAVTEDGKYCFVLDENGYNNMAYVTAIVQMAVGENTIELGQTFDIQQDEENPMKYADWFDGSWISLPDGQNLALYVVSQEDNIIVYSSPVTKNGEKTNLRITHNKEDGSITVDGTIAGISSAGFASTLQKLKDGDVIVPQYKVEGSDEPLAGGEYTVEGDSIALEYNSMESGSYNYAFMITDIFGGKYQTPFGTFNVSEDGSVSFGDSEEEAGEDSGEDSGEASEE